MAEDVRRIVAEFTARNKAAGEIASFERGMGRVSKSVNKVSSDFMRMAGIAGGTYLISRGIRESITEFAAFEKQISMVSTMLDDQTMRYMPAYSKQLKTMSIQFAEGTGTLSKGTYDILSASIAPAKAMDTLAVSTIAAKAGFTDTAVSADAITTILNSYSIGAERAGDVSDKLFAIVKRGKTTYAELAPNIGKVAALASTAGESFDDLGASIATMTRAGVATEITMTSLRAIILSFLKPQADSIAMAKKYDVVLNSQTLRTIGLTGVIEKLKNATAEELAIIVPTSRAITGFAAAVQNATGLARDKELMINSLGLTMEAYGKATNNLSFELDRMNQILKQTKVIIGGQLAPALRDNMYPVLKATITGFGYMASGVVTVRETLRRLSADVLWVAGNTAKATASIVESAHKLYELSPQSWIHKKIGIKAELNTEELETFKAYGDAMVEQANNMFAESNENMLELPSLKISKGFKELDKLIEDSKKLQVAWSKGGEIKAAGGIGTEGAAALTTEQIKQAQNLAEKRTQITARMYDDLQQYDIGYKDAQLALLKIQYDDYGQFIDDKILLDKWYQAQRDKLDLEIAKKTDPLKGYFMELERDMSNTHTYISGHLADVAADTNSTLKNSFKTAMAEGGTFRDFMGNVYSGISDSFADMAAQMAADAMMLAFIKPLLGSLGLSNILGGTTGTTGPVGVDINPAMANVAHGGGIMGETSFPTRVVPSTIFANAPRLHLGTDEYPAILQKGEKVISKNDVRRGGSGVTNIYFNITTPNADSFRRSKTQIMNDFRKVSN